MACLFAPISLRQEVRLCFAWYVEFLIQLKMTRQIVNLHKKVITNGDEKLRIERQKAKLVLVLAKLCEGLLPIAYAICFSMAYYGPNAKLMGNIGSILIGAAAHKSCWK